MTIVVGGHSRKIGKSSVVAALISAFPGARWTAIKITSHRHDAPGNEPSSLTREWAATATDSGRYLAAGAARSFLLRASASQLEQTLPDLKTVLNTAANAIIESNRIIEYIRPDLYLLVVDPAVEDWKPSALRHLAAADAILLVKRASPAAGAPELPTTAPRFYIEPPSYTSAELAEFVARRLGAVSGIHAVEGEPEG